MSRSKFHEAMLFVLLALAVAITPAYSTTITTSSSLASWQAAASGISTIDFTSTAVGTTGGTLTVGGVQFMGYTSNGTSESVHNTTGFSYGDFGTGNALYTIIAGTTLPYIHIVLPSAVTAAGMNLWTRSSAGLSFTVTVAGTPFTVATNSAPASGVRTPPYFGVTSDTPFTTIDLSLPAWNTNIGTYQFVDNVSYGSAAATDTPEAATCLLIRSGLIGLVLLRRRLSRNKPEAPPIPDGPLALA